MSIETYQHRGYAIKIEHDDDPQNPREECENITVMACFHKRYRLGDQKHGYKSQDYSGWDEMEAAIIDQEDPAVILPLYLYDHSGITIRTTPFPCPWDSGQIGFVWMTKKAARENWSWKRLTAKRLAQVRDFITKDVACYDDFITGSVYGYRIEDPDGNEIDASCWGYFGYDETKEDGNLVADAKAAIDTEIAKREKAKQDNPRQLELSGVLGA